MSQVKTVLFDLFETLITQYDPDFRKWQKIGLHRVLSLSEAEFRKEYAQTQKDRHEGKFKTRREVAAFIAKRRNLTINEDLMVNFERELDRSKTNAFQDIDNDIKTMLLTLRSKGIQTCIITNCEWFEVDYFKASELPQFVDKAIFSCELEAVKPDKRIYEAALKVMNTDPDQSIFIGDGGSQELQGARAVGIPAYQAFWFLKRFERDFQQQRIQPFEKLYHPGEVLDLVIGK